MSARTIYEKRICPFTLEEFSDCCTSKAVYPQNVCPFTLEPCLLQGKAADHTRSKLKTDNRVFTSARFRQSDISIGKETAIPRKGDHKNQLPLHFIKIS